MKLKDDIEDILLIAALSTPIILLFVATTIMLIGRLWP